MCAGACTQEGGRGDRPRDGIAHPRHGKEQWCFAQARFLAPPYALDLTDPALISKLLSQGYSPRNNKMDVTVV
jgi:hypothetical protein